MKILMKKTARGAVDGTKTHEYKAGTTHDLGPEARAVELGQAFVRMGVAEELTDKREAELKASQEKADADAAKRKAEELEAKRKESDERKAQEAKDLLAAQEAKAKAKQK